VLEGDQSLTCVLFAVKVFAISQMQWVELMCRSYQQKAKKCGRKHPK
jgi:hypothetical protein